MTACFDLKIPIKWMGYNPVMASWSGKTLGKVQIGEMIARGGMAEVYFGEHTLLDRKVAVKIMRDHVDEDPETRARFEREARVMANLHHPNIIQIFDYDLADGRPCIVMELVTGTSLGMYLKSLQKRDKKLSYHEIARLLLPIASAIDYAHNQNIVHRDIKPANILLRPKGGSFQIEEPLPADIEPVLTDFGLVRLLDSTIQTSTGTVSGTPAYMSPEQARGDKVDRKTDIYSLGVVLYEMIAGVVPFDAESSFGVLMKHLNDPPPPIPGISSDLQAVINRALAKNPEDRYHSASDLVNEFIAVFQGQTIAAETQAILQKAAQAQTKKTSVFTPLLMAVGALILVAVGALAFFLLRPGAKPTRDENLPVGRISYFDFNWAMDKAVISVNGLPMPERGKHYEVWYLAQGGEIRRNVGMIPMTEAGGQITFLEPEARNLLEVFDQVEVTLEPDNDPNPNEPSGRVVASSVFPPLALVHVRHLVVSFADAPEGTPLVSGLWYMVDAIDTSILELNDAFAAGDEATFRVKIEEIINQTVGEKNAQLYKDWNGDTRVSDPGDGYGLLGQVDQGYAAQTISHVQFAAQSADATQNIQTHSEHIIVCVNNITGWSEQILELAIRLQDMPFGTEMEPLVAEILSLSSNMLYGADTNGNGLIEPVIGEGGADTAYEHAYYLTDMPLLPGAHRVPPPAQIP
ncbi:MAG TPA: protein kinase [Anaerolineales bacterium]|nr:protein kinase [Anaerolineales bacterium]